MQKRLKPTGVVMQMIRGLFVEKISGSSNFKADSPWLVREAALRRLAFSETFNFPTLFRRRSWNC